jgi:hypothetical protein
VTRRSRVLLALVNQYLKDKHLTQNTSRKTRTHQRKKAAKNRSIVSLWYRNARSQQRRQKQQEKQEV